MSWANCNPYMRNGLQDECPLKQHYPMPILQCRNTCSAPPVVSKKYWQDIDIDNIDIDAWIEEHCPLCPKEPQRPPKEPDRPPKEPERPPKEPARPPKEPEIPKLPDPPIQQEPQYPQSPQTVHPPTRPPQPLNGLLECDPIMLPYMTSFYPYGPCGPQFALCPYVAVGYGCE